MFNRLYAPLAKFDEVEVAVADLANIGKGVPQMAADGYQASALVNGWHVLQQDPELYKNDTTDHLYLINSRTGQQLQLKFGAKELKPNKAIEFNPKYDTVSSEMEAVFTCFEDAPMLHWKGLTKETAVMGSKFHYLKTHGHMVRADVIVSLANLPIDNPGREVMPDSSTNVITVAEAKPMAEFYLAAISTLTMGK